MAICNLLWLPVLYYGYLYYIVYYGYTTLATCSLLWLPAVYYGYLQSIMSTCSLLWLPVVYHGYLHVVYYGYLVSRCHTLFSRRDIIACNISTPQEKGLVRFTGLTGTETTIVVVVVN